MTAIDFKRIRATPKSQNDSFEGLATLLFQRSFSTASISEFVSLRGDGGDGGVEAYFRDATGAVHGMQAKYFFKLGASEFSQIKDSLATALSNYPELQSYVIYVPFDLTGKKAGGAKGKSESERFQAWRQSQEAMASSRGKTLNIELIGAAQARAQLLDLDAHGGLRRYWFDNATLTENTIRTCLDAAKAFAGPRYTETLDVETSAHETLDFFGGTGNVQGWVVAKVKKLAASFGSLARGLDEVTSVLPAGDQVAAANHVASIQSGLKALFDSTAVADVPAGLLAAAGALQPLVISAEDKHYSDFCAKYGAEKDTQGFRQWHAEYMCDFPAGNLDRARDAKKALTELIEVLGGPAIQATRAQSLLLVGPAGVGKTHAIVSATERRLARGAYSVVLFGDDFDGTSPWEVIRSKLGFAGSVGRDDLFECLEASSATHGYPFVVFIDALNEGPLGSKWKDRLPEFLGQVKGYPGIKVCVSTRDTYKDLVVDNRFPGYAFTHPGFRGQEFEALQHFALAYGLHAEITPLFSEEAANPLFLHLACKTMQANGATALDLSLKGFLGLFEGYLELCNDRVRGRLALATPGNLVRQAMLALAGLGATTSAVPWSDACKAVEPTVSGETKAATFLEELRKEGLVIVTPTGSDEYAVRFGYQRYGDVLRCIRLIESLKVNGTLDIKGLAAQLSICDVGLREALASVLPESEGIEVTDSALGLAREVAYPLFLQGLPWRARDSINYHTEAIFRDALRTEAWPKVFETSLMLSLVPAHVLNAEWLDGQLRAQKAANRDGFVWYALGTSYDDSGVVRSLVDAALRCDLPRWPAESRRLAGVTLGWLCSSPDRRVRDQATKGLVRLIRSDITLAKELARHFDDCDDEYVLESISSAVYCACLLMPQPQRQQFSAALDALLTPGYDGPNAVVRDSIKLLGMAIGPDDLPMPTRSKLNSYPTPVPLPTSWPTAADAKELLKHGSVVANMDFTPSRMQPDFWRYEVEPELRRFDLKSTGIAEENLAFWVMTDIMQLGFPGTDEVCLAYDSQTAGKHGQGRGRSGHAERLGKKYSWIAFHRLVGMLSDNLSPAKGWSGTAPPKEALSYALRLRKADWTDIRDIESGIEYPADLLPNSNYPFPRDGDDRLWLDRDDLTPHDDCLIRRGSDGVEWFALYLSASSDEKSPVDDFNTPHKRITLDYWSVLAPASCNFKRKRRDLDQALQHHPSSYRALFAEYPREAAFDYCIEYGEVGLNDGALTSTQVNLMRGSEWGYDYSWKERAPNLLVPTKDIIGKLQLNWDHHSGWVDQERRLGAFHVDQEECEALFLRKDLIDKYLRDQNQILYIRRFVYRGTIGGADDAPALDVDSLLVYRPQSGLTLLDHTKELFERAP